MHLHFTKPSVMSMLRITPTCSSGGRFFIFELKKKASNSVHVTQLLRANFFCCEQFFGRKAA
jgi:hypothetical protein